jgi:hypothetical protein
VDKNHERIQSAAVGVGALGSVQAAAGLVSGERHLLVAGAIESMVGAVATHIHRLAWNRAFDRAHELATYVAADQQLTKDQKRNLYAEIMTMSKQDLKDYLKLLRSACPLYEVSAPVMPKNAHLLAQYIRADEELTEQEKRAFYADLAASSPDDIRELVNMLDGQLPPDDFTTQFIEELRDEDMAGIGVLAAMHAGVLQSVGAGLAEHLPHNQMSATTLSGLGSYLVGGLIFTFSASKSARRNT